MKHSFYSNQKSTLLVLGMTLCTMCGCSDSKAVRNQIAVEESDSTEAIETCAAEDDEVDTCVASVSSSPTASSPSTKASGELAEKAYNRGYEDGMRHHTGKLSHYTSENEKILKNEYMLDCRYELGKENYNNKALYNEYRRGFLKGYEDGNNALQ